MTNCRVLGISNARVKIQIINSLVTSVLLYGCIIYACLSNVEITLDQANPVFSKAEIFARKMLRWVFNFPKDTRKSFIYVVSNQTTIQILAQKAVFRFFKSIKEHPRFITTFISKIRSSIDPEFLGTSTITWWE